MPRKPTTNSSTPRLRQYMDEVKQEAVQMLLDNHSATLIAERSGIPDNHPLYSRKVASLR